MLYHTTAHSDKVEGKEFQSVASAGNQCLITLINNNKNRVSNNNYYCVIPNENALLELYLASFKFSSTTSSHLCSVITLRGTLS